MEFIFDCLLLRVLRDDDNDIRTELLPIFSRLSPRRFAGHLKNRNYE